MGATAPSHLVIEFVLLVSGVFPGVQVANSNEARAFDSLERDRLRKLREALSKGIERTEARRYRYSDVNAAGTRAMAFLDKGKPCTDRRWAVPVDTFLASQWTQEDRMAIHDTGRGDASGLRLAINRSTASARGTSACCR